MVSKTVTVKVKRSGVLGKMGFTKKKKIVKEVEPKEEAPAEVPAEAEEKKEEPIDVPEDEADALKEAESREQPEATTEETGTGMFCGCL